MKKNKRIPVPEEIRIRLLLWCNRHCCFCGKACTTNIEIHHIDGNTSNNDEENLTPVCFDCHGELKKYNPKHPKGSQYRDKEIKARRNQIYDLHTAQYLRQVDIQISNHFHTFDGTFKIEQRREPGDVSCSVRSTSSDIPVKLRLRIEPYSNSERLTVDLGDLYNGQTPWNLNPLQIVFGHFKLPILEKTEPFNFRVEIFPSIIDTMGREHLRLPFSFVWNDPGGDWWFDPRIISSVKS